MTQYDSLSSTYNVFDTLPYRQMEWENVFRAVSPLLRPEMKVLELACGTGFYTSRFLDWGVTDMTAVDISRPMLAEAAIRAHKYVEAGNLRLIAADCTKIQSFAPDHSSCYFDLAFGAWFLNYADDKGQLRAMFRNIAQNLRPGAPFIGVVPHPTDDVASRAEVYNKPPFNRMFPRNEYTENLESGDGYGLRVFLNNNGVDFMTWHMKREVYENAARLAGFKGRLEWKREFLLNHDWKQRFDLTSDEWRIRGANPHFGILVAWK
ncbi:ToxA protein [Metarhizium acridum CQMa 102]|uniref:ToxA protein n=1 Tax=Metarhizium acridum (strain CQMa 102) TaxID=655827 RepID=E9EAM6_METAQ|nr:ToxA protein [Metarhizium acridum CQMa 102]EFY87026.1 ToxA protein [Metarhizium acridum CQMa 102]